MTRISLEKPIKLAVAFAVALQLMVLPMATAADAQQRDQKRYEQRDHRGDRQRVDRKRDRHKDRKKYQQRHNHRGRHGHYRQRHVIRRLPHRHRRVYVHKKPYYYHSGFFFTLGSGGYVRVQAPVGAIVVDLPLGAVSLRIGGLSYYHFSGVYYRPVPTGYVVVERPVAAAPPVEEDIVDTTVAVTAGMLNVRQGPAADHSVVARVPRGTLLAVVGTAPGWLYVELPGGDLGWVMEAYTRPVEPPAQG